MVTYTDSNQKRIHDPVTDLRYFMMIEEGRLCVFIMYKCFTKLSVIAWNYNRNRNNM